MANTDLSGQILDSSGTAIPNAQVYLWREDLAGAGGVVAVTTADSSGNFSFTAHPDGSGSSESWHVAAKDPNANVQLQSAYGVTASPPTSVNSQFDVSITGTSSPVPPGETLTVDASLTNSGTDSDTQTITLDVDNGVGQVDSSLEAAQGGASKTVPLSWAVPSGQTEQDYQATVSSADDTASQTVTVSSGPSLVAQQDLVAWYPMEDGDARDAANTTDFGDATAYDGTVNGATHDPDGGVTDVTAGPSSGAFSFTSDRIDIGNIPSIEGVSQLTVCAWLNETDGNNSDKEPVGGFSPGSFNNALGMSANGSGNLVYRVRKSGTRLNTSTNINRDGTYSHFAFVFDNGSLQGYKNGSPTGSVSGGPSTTPSVKMNLGGRFSSGNNYIGDIDDVRFYASALTDSEINQICTNTQP